MGVYRQDVEVGNYDRGRLRLSGLELAFMMADEKKGRHTPFRIQRADRKVSPCFLVTVQLG